MIEDRIQWKKNYLSSICLINLPLFNTFQQIDDKTIQLDNLIRITTSHPVSCNKDNSLKKACAMGLLDIYTYSLNRFESNSSIETSITIELI